MTAEAMHAQAPAAPPVPFRNVGLPAEHGGWGLVAEPVLLGLAVAPGWAALGTGIAYMGGFLLHQPLKLVLADLRRGATFPRTVLARQACLLYGSAAGAGLALAAATAEGPFWIPIVAAAPVAAVQLAQGASNQSRSLLAEVAGATALATAAPAALLASGVPGGVAAALGAILAGRGITSVLYVRARLRRDRGLPSSSVEPIGAHLALLAGAATLVAAGLLPPTAVIAAGMLLLRAAWGLSPWHRVVRPKVVGFQELAFGVLTAVLLVLGYRLA